MGHEIDWKIKWSNASDWSKRKTAHDSPTSSGKFLPIKGKELAIDACTFLGGHVESKDGTVDFDARSLDRLACLLGESAREFILAFAHERGNLTQNSLAFECGKPASRSESLDGRSNSGFSMLLAALGYTGDQAAVIWGPNLNKVTILLPSTVDKETVGRDRRDRHFAHQELGPQSTGCGHYRTFRTERTSFATVSDDTRLKKVDIQMHR